MNDHALRERIRQWKEWERRWAVAPSTADSGNTGALGEGVDRG